MEELVLPPSIFPHAFLSEKACEGQCIAIGGRKSSNEVPTLRLVIYGERSTVLEVQGNVFDSNRVTGSARSGVVELMNRSPALSDRPE